MRAVTAPLRQVRFRSVALVALVALAAGCHLRLVSDDPVNWTPHVLDGRVNAVAEVGGTVFLGGEFTRAREAGDGTEVSRSNFLAFDAATGEISDLAPAFDGSVDAILPAPDGQSLYVSGYFFNVDGRPFRSLVRIDASTGLPVDGFTVPPITGRVRDLLLRDGRLWLAGAFTHVDGVAQLGLATVDADTGAHDPYMALGFAGTHNGGTTQVLKIDATPAGDRLFAIGNFTSVDGAAAPQVVALDLTGPSAARADWGTSFYTSTCSSSFNTYLRDVDVSSDGTFVVMVTTGAYRNPPSACDTIARFEVGASGTGLSPTWVTYTGGDTITAVLAADEAVYVGGHFRWVNNPHAGDRASRGAVSREGIAALDTANGLPFTWNPGRTLGVGVFDLLMTDDGLWVASDTDRIGNFEFHGRIALFPKEGGKVLPHGQTGRFPGRAYVVDPPSAPGTVVGRQVDASTVGPAQTFAGGGIDWSQLRAAVMIDGTVYAGFGSSGGPFVSRTYDGTTWGPAVPVDGADQLVVDTAWHADVANLTGLFFADGRLYYTIAGNSSLFYRYFTPESRVVGAQRFTASGSVTGLSFSTVRGMFLGGGHLYWTTADGHLHRIGWSGTAPVAGTAAPVSGPTVDGVDWRGKALFLETRQT